MPTPDTAATPDTASVPEPAVRTTAYAVSCVPEDNINAWHFTVKVEYRGRGLWAVTDGIGCFNIDGDRSYESTTSERRDEWLAEHRFELDTALALAKRVAPLLRVNGYSVADVLARADR